MIVGLKMASRACVLMACTLAVGATLPMGTALADEEPEFIEAYASFEVQNDWTYDSDDPDNELNDLYATVEPTVVLNFSENLRVTAHGILEPVRDPDPGEDRFFEDEGLYMESLFAEYANDTFSVIGGKFTPNFGLAWDIAPGIYGTDFAEDYELAERIGFGGSYTLPGDSFGKHAISASVFFVDTSILSESLITNRGRTRESDGGVGNTESLENFAIALDGGEFPDTLFNEVLPGESPIKGLTYQLAVVSQAEGEDGNARETGIVASVAHEIPVTDSIVFLPVLENAYFFNADGLDDQDRNYLTAGGTAVWRENWNVALSYTWRETMPDNASNISDHLFQVSAGYVFDFGLGIDVGWRFAEEEKVESHTLGALLTYCLACPED